MFKSPLGEKILNTLSQIGIGNGANVSKRNLIVKAHFLTEKEKQEVRQQIHSERVILNRKTGVER